MSLPYNWTLAPVLSICTARMGPTILAKDLSTKGLPVFSAGGSGEPWGYTELPVERFGPRTIVLSARGSIGNPRLPGLCAFTSTQTTIAATCAEEIAPRYLRYALQTLPWQEIASGAAIPMLTISRLGEQSVPLAPTEEQKRIADKLDGVLARVDAVNTRLARVAPILKRFRQSVLAAATSGRLTEDWRQANPEPNAKDWLDGVANTRERARRKSLIEPLLSDLPRDVELPKTWTVAGLDALAANRPHALKAGPFGSALKKSMYVPQGYKIYGQEQVIAGDEKVGDYFISDEKFAELRACAVEPGDILISLVGTIGRVLVLSADALPGIINPRLVKLSLHTEVNRGYFSFYLRSPVALSFFEGNSHGGTMDILNLGILRSLPILMPPPEEQAEIVHRVETLFAFAECLEARLQTAQVAAERLTPALLAKAFRGELVPQDPNDEPASELLRRLQQEAPSASTKRGRKGAA